MKFKCTVKCHIPEVNDTFFVNSDSIYNAWKIFLKRLDTRMHHDYDMLISIGNNINFSVNISEET